jgi:cell division protein ZapD
MASGASVLYEQPLSERMRTFLRLEYLYAQFCYNLGQPSDWCSRAAIASMLEIVAILGRGDVRGDVLKELERQIGYFDRYQDSPGVDAARLQRVLRNLQDLRQRLFAVGPQFLQPLRDNEFLAAVKHRSAIPGGTCEFDLPIYSNWLRRSVEQRAGDIERWMQHLRPLCDSIAELLWLLRGSGQSSDQVANNGVYQHGQVGDSTVGLLRVALPGSADLFPEISGSHHRFTIRFMQWPDVLQRPVQVNRNVSFRLILC